MCTLSENEKTLMVKIGENRIEDVRQLLSESDVRVNCYDSNGMSPLQHAAYKGYYEICKLLIESYADVNLNNHHTHGYTALMFAAIGGHRNVVNLLLESGSNINAVNSVGRNASQMAAFVGQHETVSIINNFISREEIEYYTRIHGLETEPYLSMSLVPLVHAMVCQTNINPVRIALFIKKNRPLIDNGKSVAKVLALLCEKQIKMKEPNEMLALKFHHLAFVLKQILTYLNKSETNESQTQSKGEENAKKIETLIKSWLNVRESDSFPVFLERLLRQSIREFPFYESGLLQQLVRTLASVEIGEEPSAVTILSQTINGQKGFDEDSPVCGTCGETSPDKRCSQCKAVQYCDHECQRLHWNTHKKFCKKLCEKNEITKENEENNECQNEIFPNDESNNESNDVN